MPRKSQIIYDPSFNKTWPSEVQAQENIYDRWYLVWRMLFVILVLLYVAFIKLSVVGYPVRTLLVAGYAASVVFLYHGMLLDLIRRYGAIIFITVFIGLLGSVLTLAHGTTLPRLINEILAELMQPLLVFVTVYVLTRLTTPVFTSCIYILVAAISGIFCLLQFYGLDMAWQIRETIGQLQGEPLITHANVVARGRPVGLSLTPITFSYHVITAYVLASFMYRKGFINFGLYGVIVIFTLAIGAANGTRSLLLGVVVHELLLHLGRRERKSLFLMGCLTAISIGGFMWLEALDSRITTLQDASAMGRLALYKYGLLLALDHPIGFGWEFDPGAFAWLYWENISDFVNSDGVFRLGIHNAFLSFILTYGFIAVMAVLALAIVYRKEAKIFIAIFSAYLVHMFFHNAGIFGGEYYFWFVAAIILAIFREEGGAQEWRPAPEKAHENN